VTRNRIATAALVTLATGAAIAAGLGEGLQRQVTDRWFPRGRVDDRLLVLAIDQRSAEVPPGHGWGFVQHAELVGALDRAGARAPASRSGSRLWATSR
jgi:CHASE2 domain-containing sensor protein